MPRAQVDRLLPTSVTGCCRPLCRLVAGLYDRLGAGLYDRLDAVLRGQLGAGLYDRLGAVLRGQLGAGLYDRLGASDPVRRFSPDPDFAIKKKKTDPDPGSLIQF